MKFPYEDLYYLKARGPDDKRPAESWGGYGQDFAEADTVYTHADVRMLPGDHFLVNSMKHSPHMSHQMLIFDLDIYKAPAGFDADRVTVPTNTPVVKTPSGGFHIYYAVNTPVRGQESDFRLNAVLPFDIDVRGEYVKHHVVAPNAVPGVGGGYELVNDAPIKHVPDPGDAAEAIKIDGEPAIYHESGDWGGADYEREEIDPPQEMPKCYAAGLTLRAEAPDDHDHTHKVNVLTALAGLAAGYSVEQVADHFIDDYYPGDPAHADRERTEYHVEHIAGKLDRGEYSPPKVSTLHSYGILPRGEWCYCGLPGHDGETDDMSRYYTHAELDEVARLHDLDGDPYDDNQTLVRACLYARDENPNLADEKPPYGALVAVARDCGLNLEDSDNGLLGESTYNVARRIFDDLDPGDV
ncbi:hypothetical protein ACKVMT_06155 [Halobacteriales archaeon Cl-PHB]